MTPSGLKSEETLDMAVDKSTPCTLIILVLLSQQASHRNRHSWILPQWDAARETLRIPTCINLSESVHCCSPCLSQLTAIRIKHQPSLQILEDQYKILVYGTRQTAIGEIYQLFMMFVFVDHPARKKRLCQAASGNMVEPVRNTLSEFMSVLKCILI